MIRETWVFPSDGGPCFKKGEGYRQSQASRGITIMPDLPDFVSTVDGKRYSGRAGLREHNRVNQVTPVEDLRGLPTLMTNSDTRGAQAIRADKADRKGLIIRQVNQHVR